jgi:acylphosphatase
MADHRAITAKITGRVQGVGYRYAVVQMAQELGLVGWVRNASDGSVETWAQGDEVVLEQFIAFLKQGPRSARVRSVVVLPVVPDSSLHGFAVRF